MAVNYLIWVTLLSSNVIYSSPGDTEMTGYRVNPSHDGFFDIDVGTFNPTEIKLKYEIQTNCTNEYSLFVNGLIYCTNKNMILSYYAHNGSNAFWYIYLDDTQSLQNPVFSLSADGSPRVVTFAVGQKSVTILAFDAISGQLMDQVTITGERALKISSYSVGSLSSGMVYFTRSFQNESHDSRYDHIWWNTLDAFDIDTFKITQSKTIHSVYGSDHYTSLTPVICHDSIIISSDYSHIMATDPTELETLWSRGSINFQHSAISPVCLVTTNGYRMIARSDLHCYLLNQSDGSLINKFLCPVAYPMIHYDKKNYFPDIAILETGVSNQIVAVEIKDDNFNGRELWYGAGRLKDAFIFADYFLNGFYDGTALRIFIYGIYNGELMWNQTLPHADFSVFGGTVNGEFMIIVRSGHTMYAFQ